MASKINLKNLLNNKKLHLFTIISFFAIVLSFGIKSVYAYYHMTSSFSLIASLVGDFEKGTGDINIMVYKEVENGEYARAYAVPSLGYEFDDTKTTCSIECDKNNTSDCYYSYDNVNKKFTVTSKENVTCKFYFNETSKSHINVNIMKEDIAGTTTYNGKNFSIAESIPAYGYTYAGYTCDNAGTVNYNAETKKFSVSTTTNNNCYAYFTNTGNSDLTVNVFVQKQKDSTIYNLVETIPANVTYKLSTVQASTCYDANGVDTGVVPEYTDGYVVINSNIKQTCNVYLDVVE